MAEIYQGMIGVLFLANVALDAVLRPNPELRDRLYRMRRNGKSLARYVTRLSKFFAPDWDEFFRSWSELDNDTIKQLETTFSREEWAVLTTKGAWQNGRRLHQITGILLRIEHGIAEHFDKFDAVLRCGLLGDCNFGQYAHEEAALAG